MSCSPCISLILKFILSVILYIVFIPGTLFTLPETEDYNSFWSKVKVNLTHGILFIIVYYLFNKAACINTTCKISQK